MNGKFRDDTLSWIEGCTEVSAGCRFCWLRDQVNMRQHHPNDKIRAGNSGLLTPEGKWNGVVRFRKDRLDIPLRARKPTVFAIWSDLYHEAVTDEQIAKALHAMASAERHTFLIVTKRPERAATFLAGVEYWEGWYTHNGAPIESYGGDGHIVSADKYEWEGSKKVREDKGWPIPNVYHLITVENQEMADKRIPHALKIPGKVGLLIEPMLGPVDLSPWDQCDQCGKMRNQFDPFKVMGKPWASQFCFDHYDPSGGCDGTFKSSIDFVILGGETGPHARPMHPDWARSVRDQCAAAGVPFFFKSNGEWIPASDDRAYGRGRWQWTDGKPFETGDGDRGMPLYKWIGKKENGRLLDGREHNELPWRGKDEHNPRSVSTHAGKADRR